MQTRILGGNGLEVSVFGFGLMTLGGTGMYAAFGSTPITVARRQIDIALEAGVNLLDTADVYSDGQSEEMLGSLIRGRRSAVVLATKVYGRTGAGPHDIGLSRRHLIAGCESSLKRLRTDWIDLYQVHNFDGAVPLEETLGALNELVRAGKVRHIGCSNHYGWELTRALSISEREGFARYVSQQIQYSLLVRDAEIEILPAGIAQGVGALIYSPLAGGYLSGKYREGPVTGEARLQALNRISSLDDLRARQLLDVSSEIASAHSGATVAQVALNWLRGADRRAHRAAASRKSGCGELVAERRRNGSPRQRRRVSTGVSRLATHEVPSRAQSGPGMNSN